MTERVWLILPPPQLTVRAHELHIDTWQSIIIPVGAVVGAMVGATVQVLVFSAD